MSDIFQLQDELARAIARALRVELGVGQPVPLVAVQTHIPEAYNWFMRGRALYDWGNPKVSDQTISYFEKAVEADPDYALAWGYLAAARAASFLWRLLSDFRRPFGCTPNSKSAIHYTLIIRPISPAFYYGVAMRQGPF